MAMSSEKTKDPSIAARSNDAAPATNHLPENYRRLQEEQTNMFSGGYGNGVMQAMYGYQQYNGYGQKVTQTINSYNQPANIQAKAATSPPFHAPAKAITPTVIMTKPGEEPKEIGLPGNVQCKLTIGASHDSYEQEADEIAEQVIRMPAQPQEVPVVSQVPVLDSLQRMCRDCEERMHLQRVEMNGGELQASDQIANRLQSRKGQGSTLTPALQAQMGQAFGTDFSPVRLHTDSEAVQMSQNLNAQAFTHMSDIYFNQGKYEPGSSNGKRLLAHELTHVVQQMSSRERIQKTSLGTRFSHPRGIRTPYRSMTASFDGREFILHGDTTQLLRVPAQSGRPYSVRAADATACGGSTSDSYLNNPRYVGISDNGPIPEGEFWFRASRIATFSSPEQLRMIGGGSFTDPFGASLHGGDWGSGRVALNKINVLPGSRGCGNTSTRSGFYLHGGSMPGSSGCIDIGNSGIDSMIPLLAGYTGRIVVTVRYTSPPPSVGPIDRALGRFTYPPEENPGILDRLNNMIFGD